MKDDDPGWSLAWKSLPSTVIPGVASRRAKRADPGDTPVSLRALFLSFVVAVVLIGLVAIAVGNTSNGTHPTSLSLAVVAGVGCLSLAAQWLVAPELDRTSLPTLKASYRSRFFLRVAYADAGALVGFIIGIRFGPRWVYFVGAAFSILGLLLHAPTRAHLARDQASLAAAGCRLRLIDALYAKK